MMSLAAHTFAVPAAARSALALLVLCIGCAGCESTSKPPLATPEQRAAAVPMQTEEFAKLGYRIDWRGFATMLPGANVKFFDIFDDIVVAQNTSGVVTVLESKNGATRWSDQTAGELTKFIGNVRDLDRLIVSSDSEAYFYDVATGTLKAKQRLAIVSNTRPVQVNDILVYGAASGQVLGHLTLNGFKQWGAMMKGSIDTDPIDVGRGRVALVSSGGDFYVIDGGTGLIQARGTMFAGSETPLAASEKLVFVASEDHSLYALSIDEGRQLWRVRTDAPLRRAPTFHEGRVYCDMGAGGLSAFDSATGKQIWSNPKVSGTIVALRNKKFVVFDGANAMTIDPAKGTIIDTVALTNIKMLKPDVFVDGHLYAISANGVIAKLAPR